MAKNYMAGCVKYHWVWGFFFAALAEAVASGILLGLIFFGNWAGSSDFDIITFNTQDFGQVGASNVSVNGLPISATPSSSVASITLSVVGASSTSQDTTLGPRAVQDSGQVLSEVRDTGSMNDDEISFASRRAADADSDAFMPVAGANGTNGTAKSVAVKAVLDNSPAWKEYHVWNFISQHLMAISCVGIFEDNSKATRQVKECRRTAVWRISLAFNLTSMLDAELEAGPKNRSIDKMAIADGWREKLSPALNTWAFWAFLASLPLYICFAFTVLAMMASLRAWFTLWYDTEVWVDMWGPPEEGDVSFYRDIRDEPYYIPTPSDYHRNVWITINLYISFIAAALAFLANLIMVIFGCRTVAAVNNSGPAFGVTAKLGTSYQVVVWIAWALLTASVLYWFSMFRKRGLLTDAKESCWKCMCLTCGRKLKWDSMSDHQKERLLSCEATYNRERNRLRADERPFVKYTKGKWMHEIKDGLNP